MAQRPVPPLRLVTATPRLRSQHEARTRNSDTETVPVTSLDTGEMYLVIRKSDSYPTTIEQRMHFLATTLLENEGLWHFPAQGMRPPRNNCHIVQPLDISSSDIWYNFFWMVLPKLRDSHCSRPHGEFCCGLRTQTGAHFDVSDPGSFVVSDTR